jgi:hypothetical protein
MQNDEDARSSAPQDTSTATQDSTAQAAPAKQVKPSDGENNVKRAGTLGLVTILLGNVAAFTGAVGKLDEAMHKLQEQLNLAVPPYLLYAVILAIIFVGYLLAFTSVYKRLKDRIGNKMPGKGITVSGLLLIVMGGLIAVNVWAIPNPDSAVFKTREADWSNKIRQTQQSSGGFTIMVPSGPGNPVQVFATAQGLTAILTAMDWNNVQEEQVKTIRSAFAFIDSQREPAEHLWGYFPNTTAVTEIAGWVTVARIKALEHGDQLWSSESDRAAQLAFVEDDLARIMTHYIPVESGWSPFRQNISEPSEIAGCKAFPPTLTGLTDDQSKTRTYSTVMALWALIEGNRVPSVRDRLAHKYDERVRTGIGWLLSTYSKEKDTWFPNTHRANQDEDYMGLTAQALYVLYLAKAEREFAPAVQQPRWADVRHGFLKRSVKGLLIGDNSHLSDVDGYVFPFPQPLEPMTFLWAPWSMITYHYLSLDSELSASDKKMATTNLSIIESYYQPRVVQAIESGLTYRLAESLFCLSGLSEGSR